jgi:hypothetical protein
MRERSPAGGCVYRDYDIFEKLPDGTVLWRVFVPGLQNALDKMQELSKLSANEFFTYHSPTKETVGRTNVKNS